MTNNPPPIKPPKITLINKEAIRKEQFEKAAKEILANLPTKPDKLS